jgi:predicted MFS family arabinose efflux permease
VNLRRRHDELTPPGPRLLGAVLFLCLFASQAAVIALTPVLAEIAADFEISTAAAGQLRTVSGLTAAAAALSATLLARRVQLRSLLVAGVAAVGAGSLLSALAPGFAVLAAGQAIVGAGIALVTTTATAGAAEWAAPAHRARVLSWALLGPPSAWVVGMPVIGVLGEASWRYGWLALPVLAAALALAAAAAVAPRRAPGPPVPRSSLREALRSPGAASWIAGELFANSAWTGTLVYSGALFSETYGTSPTAVGLLLSAAAVAYVAGNMAMRGRVGDEPMGLLVRLALGLAVTTVAFGTIRPAVAVSAAIFSASAFLAGGRTLLGNAAGLDAAPEHRLALMAARSATLPIGYLVGAATAGAALALGGYAAYGAALGALFAAAALPLALTSASRRASSTAAAPAPTSVT